MSASNHALILPFSIIYNIVVVINYLVSGGCSRSISSLKRL